jgi:hypothetical protein
MLALEAIYGENLEVFGEKSVPWSFQVYLFSYISFLEKIIVVLIDFGLPGLKLSK